MTQLMNQFVQSAEKGYLDLRMNPNTIPCAVHSSQAVALVPGQAVKLYDDAGGVPKVVAIAADTDKIFGIVASSIKDISFPALQPIEIACEGNVIYMEASAAIARGAKVMAVVSGSKVATATNGKSCVGFAFDKAVNSGDLVRVFLQPFSSAAIAGQAADVGALGALGAVAAPSPVAATIAAITSAGGNTYSDTLFATLITEVKSALLLKCDNDDAVTAVAALKAEIDLLQAKVDGYRTALEAAGLMA